MRRFLTNDVASLGSRYDASCRTGFETSLDDVEPFSLPTTKSVFSRGSKSKKKTNMYMYLVFSKEETSNL